MDRLNEIEGRDISGMDLAWVNEHIAYEEVTVDDLPSWPITEENVRSNPQLISQTAKYLLTHEELNSLDLEYLIRRMREVRIGKKGITKQLLTPWF